MLLSLSQASSGSTDGLRWRGGLWSWVPAGELPDTGELHVFNIRVVISTALNNYED